MSLSCECECYDDCGQYYEAPKDFTPMTTPNKKCISCNSVINLGSPALDFLQYETCYDDDVCIDCKKESAACENCEENGGCIDNKRDLGTDYMCEDCGEIYLNLSVIGYCIPIWDQSMQDFLAEYHQLTGFVKPSTLL